MFLTMSPSAGCLQQQRREREMRRQQEREQRRREQEEKRRLEEIERRRKEEEERRRAEEEKRRADREQVKASLQKKKKKPQHCTDKNFTDMSTGTDCYSYHPLLYKLHKSDYDTRRAQVNQLHSRALP